MSKIRDEARNAWWAEYMRDVPTCNIYDSPPMGLVSESAWNHGWAAALDAAAKQCGDYDGAMVPIVDAIKMLRDPELRWPGEPPQADDDPNDCHDWTPKGM